MNTENCAAACQTADRAYANEARASGQIAGLGLSEAAVARDYGQKIETTVQVAANRDFANALRNLKDGSRITRAGWNGRGMYLEMQYPDKGSKMTRPYIFMKTVDNDLVPWVASQTDLLANDWAVLPRG